MIDSDGVSCRCRKQGKTGQSSASCPPSKLPRRSRVLTPLADVGSPAAPRPTPQFHPERTGLVRELVYTSNIVAQISIFLTSCAIGCCGPRQRDIHKWPETTLTAMTERLVEVLLSLRALVLAHACLAPGRSRHGSTTEQLPETRYRKCH